MVVFRKDWVWTWALLCQPVGWQTWCGQHMPALREGQTSSTLLKAGSGSLDHGGVSLGRHSVICSSS